MLKTECVVTYEDDKRLQGIKVRNAGQKSENVEIIFTMYESGEWREYNKIEIPGPDLIAAIQRTMHC